ncbi:MAG: hypothetical protein WBF21_09095 [Steroidobacteraceae bacterium]
MENQILEQHSGTPALKEARIILSARQDFRLFFTDAANEGFARRTERVQIYLAAGRPPVNRGAMSFVVYKADNAASMPQEHIS